MYKVLVKVTSTNTLMLIKVTAENAVAANIAALKVLLKKKIYVKLIYTFQVQ